MGPHAGRFSDLVTAPRGCFRIKDTAKRAITLKQMESITHTAKRLGCEMEASRYDCDLEANAVTTASAGSANGRKGQTASSWRWRWRLTR